MGKAGDPRQPPGREGPADNLQGQQHPRPPLPDLDPAGAEGATAHIPGAPPPRGGPSGYRGVLLHASAGLCAHGAPPSRQCREGGRRCVRGPARPGKVTDSPCAHKAAHEDKGGAGRPPSLGHTEQPHQTLLWRRGSPGARQAAAPAAPPRTRSSRLRHTRHRSCPAQPPPIRHVHPPQRPLSRPVGEDTAPGVKKRRKGSMARQLIQKNGPVTRKTEHWQSQDRNSKRKKELKKK